MIIKKTILIFLWLLVSAVLMPALAIGEPFESDLPSQETKQEIEKIQENLAPTVDLRQAPGEPGSSQKEVPLAGIDVSVVLILLGGIILYSLRKSSIRRKIFAPLCLLSALFAGGQLQAQLTFQANPDNVIIPPKSTVFTPVDVLYNDYYNFGGGLDCEKGGLILKVWDGTAFVTPNALGLNTTLGTVRVTADNQISYRPKSTSLGQDIISYQITCPSSGDVSQAKIYININDKPDAISDANCYVDPTGIGFEIELLAESDRVEYNVSSLSSVIAGDIDNDGLIEMLVIGMGPGNISNGTSAKDILVYNYNKAAGKLDVKYVIPITGWAGYYPNGCLAIAKITGGTVNTKSTASIFFANPIEKLLYRYDLDGTTYTETWRTGLNPNANYSFVSPAITDLMANGRQQIICADRIYDADTGILLVEATDAGGMKLVPASGRSSYSFGCFGHGLNGSSPFESSLIAVDIDGDGLPELIGGDCVYKVNIGDFTSNNTILNTYRLYRRANYKADLTTKWNVSRTEIGEGGTALADVNNDGLLEIVVSGTVGGTGSGNALGCIYIYNPRTGELMHSNAITDIPKRSTVVGPSRPFIGDVDGDGYPEFCLTSFNTLRGYKLNLGTSQLQEMWQTPTSDASSSTTLSMFDFTQDGRARMIYRDMTTLRIIRSTSTGTVDDYTFTGVYSGTLNEYPIVIDVDGDGHAEILVTSSTLSSWGSFGALQVYAAKGTKKWAPARPVWNQVAYNPVFVNDDLTIPANPINPATMFAATDGSFNRPFNNFLQQSTSLNKEGAMIMLGPDLIFDRRVAKRLEYLTGDKLKLTAGILNQGDAAFLGNITIQLYYLKGGVYTAVGGAYVISNTSLSNQFPNNTASVSYVIDNISAKLPSDFETLAMTVNLSSKPGEVPVFSGSTECFGGYNNFTAGFSLVTGERVICEGDTETVVLEGAGSYHVKWFDAATGGNLKGTGTSLSITKNADPVTYYFAECYTSSTASSPISNIRDTVFVYLAPDSLVWTGAGNNHDWHDWQNWRDPSGTLNEKALIPRGCTNVLLPVGISVYPSLENSLLGTVYSKYSSGECSNIHFAHGGELVRPDMLTYSKAYVNITFNSHRWYMFAPPLKNFYTGDIYIDDIIPANDIVKAYTKYWARRNPFTNGFWAGWTGLFHYPDQSFKPGQGVGLWISDKAVSGQLVPPQDPFDFSFPKHDTEYNVYLEDTTIPDPDDPKNPYQTARGNEHRFIFDGVAAGTNFDLSINDEYKGVGEWVMVGNPFMAHLDFDKFYAANSAKIQNFYAVLDENGVMKYYNQHGSPLSKNIAPMQAFLVEMKTSFSNLTANGNMTLSVPGDKLKSATAEGEDVESFNLRITATQANKTSQTALRFTENASDSYIAGEDIAELFLASPAIDTRSAILYSSTEDGVKTAVNLMAAKDLKDKEIPLGLWSPKANPGEAVTINVSNLNQLPSGYRAYLYDKQMDKSYDLGVNSMKSFDGLKTDENLFIDNRFFLKFVYQTSAIEEVNLSDGLIVTLNNSELNVAANEKIEMLEVFNLQGRLVFSSKVNSTEFSTLLPNETFYILRVKQANKATVRKLMNIK